MSVRRFFGKNSVVSRTKKERLSAKNLYREITLISKTMLMEEIDQIYLVKKHEIEEKSAQRIFPKAGVNARPIQYLWENHEEKNTIFLLQVNNAPYLKHFADKASNHYWLDNADLFKPNYNQLTFASISSNKNLSALFPSNTDNKGCFFLTTFYPQIKLQTQFFVETALSKKILNCQIKMKNPPLLVVSEIADRAKVNRLENKDSLHPCYKLLAINNSEQDLAAMSFKGTCSVVPNLGANFLSVVDCGLSQTVASDFVFKITKSFIYRGLSLENNLKNFYINFHIVGMVDKLQPLFFDKKDSAAGFIDEPNQKINAKQNNGSGENRHLVMKIPNSQQQPTLREKPIYLLSQKHLVLLQQLTLLINQQLTDLPSLLNLMVKEVLVGVENADFCFVVLHNTKNQHLEVTACSGIDINNVYLQKFHQDSNLLDFYQSSQEWVIDNIEKPYGQNDIAKLEKSVHNSKLFISSPASHYAVPIASDSTGNLGLLVVGNWENIDSFSKDEQLFLSAFTEVAAISIYNAKMFQAVLEEKEGLKQKNEILQAENRELEKTRYQVQVQHLQLLEVARIKSQFLATTSHELRSPLNVILGLSQLLLRQRSGSLSEQQADMMQRILNNGKHLLNIIDDMLYFAQNEAGRFSFQIEEFDFSHFIYKIIAEYRSLASEKNLNLQVEVNLKNPIVTNDSVRLKEVITKLLLNALKFTETGSVNVKLWEINSDTIAISIQDTGIGIAESDLDAIFEQFYQVDQTTTRKYQGTGLGLAIAKSLVDIMHGTINVTSKLGSGSTFCVQLPRVVKCEACGWNIKETQAKPRRIIF